MPQRQYYHAYDDRYRQIHSQNLQWFDQNPSAIVLDTVRKFAVSSSSKILEIGCGEGRDAFSLMQLSYDLLATDVSPAAISFCQNKMPEYRNRFQVLDCITESLPEKFAFIYAVAVVHMLVLDVDRDAFYHFIYDHLTDDGIALICTMGDGVSQRQTDISKAFDIHDRIHEPTGTPVRIASTSCRMVDFQTFEMEIRRNQLEIVDSGLTAIAPDFPKMMYSVVRKVL